MFAKRIAVLPVAGAIWFSIWGDVGPLRAADPTRPLEVVFAAGFDCKSRITEAAWRTGRSRDFPGGHVAFFENPITDRARILTPQQALEQIQRADIFLYSGHTVNPAGFQPPMHAIHLRDPNDKDKAISTTALDIRRALQGRRGPRLVIINGCHTTDLGDGVPAVYRLNQAFGIKDGTVGRAYIGWKVLIVGITADDHIGRLLDHWTKPNQDGLYPTLEESRRATGNHPYMTIIGDADLRYNLPFLLRSANPKHTTVSPLRLIWELKGEKTARATLDLGEKNEASLKQFGLPRKITMAATRTADGFEIRDPQFRQLVEKALNATVAALAFTESSKAPNLVQIQEATLHVRGDGDKLRVNLRIRASATIPRRNQPPLRQDVNYATEMIGVPDPPIPARPPA
jgi:hypothetical protein